MSAETQEKTIIVLDSQEIDAYERCVFHWHMYHHMNIRGKNQPQFVERGILLHYLLELYYGLKKEKGENITQDDLELIIDKGRVRASALETVTIEEVSETIWQFREYCRYYADENIIPLFIEDSFLVKIYEDEEMQVYISGKIDLVFKYASDPSNAICVMDHKREARVHEYSMLRNQFTLYAVAMNTDTVIINRVGFQKTKNVKERFLRTVFVYSDEFKQEWIEEIIALAKEMLVYNKINYYPKRRTACENWSIYGGCYLQRYCSTRPKAREFLIGKEFLLGDSWDVTKNLEGKKETTEVVEENK